MVETEGRHLLSAWLTKTSTSRAALAAKLGISGPSVTHWTQGTSRPEAHHRLALAKITDGAVPFESWFTQSESATARQEPESGPLPNVDVDPTGTHGT